MADDNSKTVERFLLDLMKIQRRYASELKNARTNRQSDVKELVDKYAAKENNHAD